MPRAAGQIDQAKNEAILDAATCVMSQRGMSVSIDEIARQAGVSKQTIYNHYGSKADLMRALIERRVDQVTAPLREAGALADPQKALADYARFLLEPVMAPKNALMLRVIIQSAAEMPEIGRAFYEAGPANAKAQLSKFLEQESREGRLVVPDPVQAAEFFGGMVSGQRQLKAMLINEGLTAEEVETVAEEAARRFLRAYAP